MIADPWLQWALTAVFVLAAGYCLRCIFRPVPWSSRVGHGFHLAMCLSMLAMIWPGTPTVSYPAQVVVFAVAVLWFVVIAMLKAAQDQEGQEGACAPGRATTWYHAAMMGAMVWMAVVMAGWTAPGAYTYISQGALLPASTGSGQGMDMDMPGMHHGGSGTSAQAVVPAWTTAVDAVVAVVFLVAALWWLRRYFVLRKAAVRTFASEWGLLCEVAMAFGMGVMTLTMV